MKKKKVTIVAFVILGIFLAGVVVVILNLGKSIEMAIEAAVPQMTGAEVDIEKVSVRPLAGKVRIDGFVLGNPKGFKSKHAVAFDTFHVTMDLGSLKTDQIHIYEVLIKNPSIIYELGLGNSNIGTIQENLNKLSGGEKTDKEDEEEKPAKPGKTVVIDSVRIEGAKVVLASKLTLGVGAPVALPKLELKDVGKDDAEGMSIGQATSFIVGAVFKTIGTVLVDSTVGVGKGVVAVGSGTAKVVGSAGKGVGNLLTGGGDKDKKAEK